MDNTPHLTSEQPQSGNARPEPKPEPAPVRGILSAIDALLRQPVRVIHQLSRPGAGGLVLSLFAAALCCLLIYGLIAGTFSGSRQLWAAPVKIAGGLLMAAFISLPSLYIFACLGGIRAGIVEVVGLGAGLLAITGVLLIGFAPVAWVFSQSTESIAAMGALHIVFGLVACFFGMRFLSAGFVYFNAASRAGLTFWKVLFLLVALQMTTALRPIIGTSESLLPKEKKFFLAHWSECVNSSAKTENAGK